MPEGHGITSMAFLILDAMTEFAPHCSILLLPIHCLKCSQSSAASFQPYLSIKVTVYPYNISRENTLTAGFILLYHPSNCNRVALCTFIGSP